MDETQAVTPTASRRLLRWAVNLVWTLALLVLVLVALYIGLGRQVMGNVHHFQNQIEQHLEVLLGQPVSIGRVEGDWRGSDPILRVNDLRLDGGGGDGASLGELRIRLDSLASLQRLRLVFADLSVSDADLTLVQGEDGRLGLRGLWVPDEPYPQLPPLTPDAPSEALSTRIDRWIKSLGELLSDPVVLGQQLKVSLETPDGTVRDFEVPRVELGFEDGMFRADGRLNRAGDGERVALFVLEGRHVFSGGFTGRAFIDVSSHRLFDPLIERYDWQQLSAVSAEASARGWADFEQGRPVRALAELDAPHLQLAASGAEFDPIEDLSLSMGWRSTDTGWEVALSDLAYRWAGTVSEPASALLRRDGEILRLQADHLDAGPLGRLMLATGILPPRAHEELENFSPQGRVGNLDMRIADAADWSLAAELENLNVEAHEGVPEVQGLDGFISVGPEQGRLLLEPGPMKLGFPELFTGPWRFDRFAGAIRWQRQPQGIRVSSDNLDARYGEQARFSGGFGLRLRPDDEDMLSLRIGVEQGRADMLADFVPRHVVPAGLYEFLSEQVGPGQVDRGWYYGSGAIGEEVAHPSFTSSMFYEFSDTTLEYHEDWPELTSASGTARVQNANAVIDLESAEAGGLALSPSDVRLGPSPDGLRVDINTGARSTTELPGPVWREQSPLGGLLGDWIHDVQLLGDADIGLHLSLFPDTPEREPDLEFSLDMADARFHYSPLGLDWDRIDGRIAFDSRKGFEDTELSARFLGEPIVIEVEESADRPVRFTQQGRLLWSELEQRHGIMLPGVEGAAEYTARFRPTEGPELRLDAALEGTQSQWPEPLNKDPGELHTLSGRLDFSEPGRVRIRGSWNPVLAFNLSLAEGGLERGAITLGARSTALPSEPGLLIGGVAGAVELGDWQAMAQRVRDSGVSEGEEEEEADTTLGSWMPRPRFDLRVAEVHSAGRNFGPVHFEATPVGGKGWNLALMGERVGGQIRIPEKGPEQGVNVALEHLSVPALDDDTVAERVPPGSEHSDMELEPEQFQAMPPVAVSVDRLSVAERELGRWRFDLESASDRLAARNMEGQIGALQVAGDLLWLRSGQGEESRFEGTLTGGSIQDLERLFNQPVPLRNARSDVTLELSWPGSLRDISLAGMTGRLGFRLEDGTIEEESEAAQVFRIFGLLNTDTIWRRLRLDFSDVYEAGIPFDELEGNAVIHEGRLILDPEVVIQAPSGGFRMSGESDLTDGSLDMRLVVVLPVTQNLPLAAVVLGVAPPVGGALFLVDRLFGGALSRVTSATYTIEGSWDDPEVSLRNLFDTESDLRRYERPEINDVPDVDGAPEAKEEAPE